MSAGFGVFLSGVVIYCAIYAMQALSLNLKFGTVGMIDLGVVGYFAVGAYSYTLVTAPPPGALDGYGIGLGWPIWAGFIIAPVVSGLFALLVGMPALRLEGDYLAIATYAFAEVLRAIFTNQTWLTNGVVGFNNLPQPFRGAFESGTSYQYFFMVMVLVVLGLLLLGLNRLNRGPFGRTSRAVRENETVALSVGKNVTVIRIKAFGLGGMIAGLAACFYVTFQTAIFPSNFVPEMTWVVWIGLTIGGVGNYLGAIIGTFVLVGAQEATRLLPSSGDMVYRIPPMRFVVMGLILILMIRFRPRGIFPERPWIDHSPVPAAAGLRATPAGVAHALDPAAAEPPTTDAV